ncbi:4'-phosphopantetheinyl transferase superfamily protein [Xenorhabdus nematophila]|uniref:4'-phosphopantetheinyl transferase family protein n=1 Tax=Xenorhabdus nematophila TaxID=628 RepID=UPI0032B71EF2
MKDEVHLWFSYPQEINSPFLLSEYLAMLNEDEKIKYSSFKFERDRHQYLITRALVRCTLSHYEKNITVGQWQFSSNQYGKPFVVTSLLTTPISFNISHTKGLIVLGLCSGCEIGIDAEKTSRKLKYLDIMDRFFSEQECRDLELLPPDFRTARFYDLWTLKEAYIKARGMGLFLPLDQFSFTFTEDGIINIEDNEDNTVWNFFQISAGKYHKISGAVANMTGVNKNIIMKKCIPLRETVDLVLPISYGKLL